jgi:hypothetical protein
MYREKDKKKQIKDKKKQKIKKIKEKDKKNNFFIIVPIKSCPSIFFRFPMVFFKI